MEGREIGSAYIARPSNPSPGQKLLQITHGLILKLSHGTKYQTEMLITVTPQHLLDACYAATSANPPSPMELSRGIDHCRKYCGRITMLPQHGVYIDRRVREKMSLRALNISCGSLEFEAAPCAVDHLAV